MKNKNYIMEAVKQAKQMVKIEATGPGDTDNAMRRLSGRHSLPYAFLWNLRFRPPKSIDWLLVETLKEAYREECRKAAKALSKEAGKALREGTLLNETDRAFLRSARRRGDLAQSETSVERRTTDRSLQGFEVA